MCSSTIHSVRSPKPKSLTLHANILVCLQLAELTIVEPLSPDAILARDRVVLAHEFHTKLSELWRSKGDVIITRWKELTISTLRTEMLKPIVDLIPQGTEFAEVSLNYPLPEHVAKIEL